MTEDKIKVEENKVDKIKVKEKRMTFLEASLRSIEKLSDDKIEMMRSAGIIDEEKFKEYDIEKLAKLLSLDAKTAVEIKNHVYDSLQKRYEKELINKIAEMQKINIELANESEKITGENNVLFETNKVLRGKYNALSEKLSKLEDAQKALQNEIAKAQVESNKISGEMNFLKAEREKLIAQIEKKHEILGSLLFRFKSIKSSYEFMKGESVFSEALLQHLGLLLDDALKHKKELEHSVLSTEDTLEQVFVELNDTIKKGKVLFYNNIKQGY